MSKSDIEQNQGISKFEEFQDLWNEKARDPILEMTDFVPDIATTSAGVLLSDLEHQYRVLGEHKPFLAMPSNVNMGLTLGLGYLESFALFMKGVTILMDDEDYHSTRKIKGALNILAGIQGLALSYNPALAVAGMGATALAAPAFAVGAFCDLLNTTIEWWEARKETTFEGWLDERVKEVNHVTKRIVTLNERKEQLLKDNPLGAFENDKLILKIQDLEKTQERLLDDITIRSRVHLNKQDQKDRDDKRAWIYNKIDSIKLNDEKKNDIKGEINKAYQTEEEKEHYEKVDNKIQEEVDNKFKQAHIDLISKSVAFTAIMLIAIAPAAGPAAPMLLSAALVLSTVLLALNIYKHREKLKTGAENIKNAAISFFSKNKKSDNEPPDFGTLAPTPNMKGIK